MKVILNTDVYNLGEEGDVREVKRGYARNYLYPQGLAVPHTKGNLAIFEQKKAAIEKRKEEKRLNARTLKQKIEEVSIVIKMAAGDTGKLFGSVTNAVLAEELAKAGVTVERKKIDVASHQIKMVGKYTAKVKLYEQEAAELKFVVESEKPLKGKPAKVEAPVEEAPAEETSEETETEAAE